jgi:hypothetical protein
MKNYNKFQKLSPQEQKLVFELCEKNTYVQAAELIAEPAPVGLSFNTSSSALKRFCARYHPDAAKTETLGQYANLLQVRHQAAEGAFAEGILALVQPSASEPCAHTSAKPAAESESPEVNTPAQDLEFAQITQAQAAAAAEAARLALRRGVFSETQIHRIEELQAEIARGPLAK